MRWLATILLAFSACGGDDAGPSYPLAVPADRAALLNAGPYTVGYRVASVTYRPVGTTADRTLKLDVWYPAVAGTGTSLVYRVAGVVQVPREGPRENADVMGPDKLPVIVYSHGYAGIGLAGFSYGEYFASWGFVLVAPDHTGNTALDDSNAWSYDFLVRPQDLSAVLDWITAGGDSPFVGHTRDDVAAIGHSFGGSTVLAALGAKGDWNAEAAKCGSDPRPGSCETFADPAARAKLDAGFLDPRIEVVVSQTPITTMFAAGQLAAISRPVMLFTARRDQTLPWSVEGEPAWRALDGADDVWVDLLNGGHYSVIAICEVVSTGLLSAVGLDVIPDGCGPDFTPIPEIMPVVTAYTHAFIRLHSLGETQWRQVIAGEPLHAQVMVTAGKH